MTKSYRMLLMGAALTLLLSCASCDKAQNTVTSPAQNELLHESHSQNEPLQESPAQNEPLHESPAQKEPLHESPPVNQGKIEKNAAAEERSVGDILLGDRHKEYGIECNECHQEDPPEKEVPTAICLSCHEDFRGIFRSADFDPHNSHSNIDDCGACHHAHKPSENLCAVCHDYDVKTP